MICYGRGDQIMLFWIFLIICLCRHPLAEMSTSCCWFESQRPGFDATGAACNPIQSEQPTDPALSQSASTGRHVAEATEKLPH